MPGGDRILSTSFPKSVLSRHSFRPKSPDDLEVRVNRKSILVGGDERSGARTHSASSASTGKPSRRSPRLGPTTVVQGIFIAFGVVTLPLAAVVVTAVLQVDSLDERGWKAVVNAEQTTKAAQELVDFTNGMERSAKQYLVLGDRELFDRYLNGRDQSKRRADLIAWLDNRGPLAAAVDDFLEKENTLYHELKNVAAKEERPEKNTPALEAAFAELSAAARRIAELSSEKIWSEANVMSSDASELKELLLWQAATVIPLTFVLAVIFTVIINRPLRQIERVIRHIGDGKLADRIEVHGPKDLEELGERLDWLRNRLADLEAQKSAFLRHVSHELKTPLTAIREGAELLADERIGERVNERPEIIRIIKESSIQLQQLIENLLKVSEGGNPVSPPKRQIATIHKLIHKVLSDHKLVLGSKAIKIDYDAPRIKLRADRERLRIIFDNLLSNAIKFSPPGGTIRIKTGIDDESVIVEFIDDGPGIDPDERDRVLEPFYQGRAMFSGHVKGTGLGLAIASEYARSHGGAIEIIERDGGGHVRVRIPRA